MKVSNVSYKQFQGIRDVILKGLQDIAFDESSPYSYKASKAIDVGNAVSIAQIKYFTSFYHLDDEVLVKVILKITCLPKGCSIGYNIRFLYSEFGYDTVDEMIEDMKEHPGEFFSDSLDEAYSEAGANEATAQQAVREKFISSLDFQGLAQGFQEELEKLTSEIEKIIKSAVGDANGNK